MDTSSPIPGLVAQIQEDRAALVAAVASVPPALRQQRPSADRWSVAEVVEHLALIEPRVVGLMKKLSASAPPLAPGAAPTGPTAYDRTVVGDRSRLIAAPEPLQPTNDMDADAGLATLERTREELLAVLEAAQHLDLGAVSQAHLFFGPLNGFQWISVHGGHEARHAAQIVETASVLREQALA